MLDETPGHLSVENVLREPTRRADDALSELGGLHPTFVHQPNRQTLALSEHVAVASERDELLLGIGVLIRAELVDEGIDVLFRLPKKACEAVGTSLESLFQMLGDRVHVFTERSALIDVRIEVLEESVCVAK